MSKRPDRTPVRQPSDLAAVLAREYLLESAAVKREVVEHCLEPIVAAARLIADTLRNEGKLLLCGNGGSAADCQHIAGELINRLSADFPRPSLPAIALTTDTSVLTSIANDFGFEEVFERQVRALGRPDDILLGISTSGGSDNILRAVATARAMGVRTVGLSGAGGRLKDLVDIAITVPSDSVHHVQEAHLAIEHLLCHLVERDLFGSRGDGVP